MNISEKTKFLGSITRKAIFYWAENHSYSTWCWSGVELDDDEDEEARNMARAWQGAYCVPRGVDLVDSVDDGSSHDRSSVLYFRAGDLAIYSYNNNAWGLCEVLPISDDPGSIVEWLSLWDELPEKWLKDLVGIEDEESGSCEEEVRCKKII